MRRVRKEEAAVPVLDVLGAVAEFPVDGQDHGGAVGALLMQVRQRHLEARVPDLGRRRPVQLQDEPVAHNLGPNPSNNSR